MYEPVYILYAPKQKLGIVSAEGNYNKQIRK